MPSPKVREGWHYPDTTKQDALKLWLVTGNLRQVAVSMHIPYDTLKTWRHSKWWSELASEIRTEGHLALSAKMLKIADKALQETMDRLENGDPVVVQKTGEIVNKPVAMRDALLVATSLQDRALKLQNSPQEEAAQMAVHDRLAQLADAFSKMAGKTKRVEVLDVEFKDAIPEEREEGLQAGSSVGEDQEAFEAEGSDSADSGPETGGEDDGKSPDEHAG
jgi:hypothetical protein